MTPVTWQPEVCPTCNRVLEGLGRWCPFCAAYTAEMVGSTTDASPATRRKIPDTRLEDERKADARPSVEALGWIVLDLEQGWRPFRCRACGADIAGGTRVPTGMPDWCVMGHGIVAWLEWKTDTNDQTDGQSAFEDVCDVVGIPYAVVRTTREAVGFLQGLLDDLKRSA